MNTVQIQLNERQLADLTELLDEGLDSIHSKLDKGQAEHYSQPDKDEIMRLCSEGVSAIRQAIEDKTYLWTSSMGDIELEIPADAVEEIGLPGQNLPAVQKWLSEPSYLKAQFDRWGQEQHDAAREYLISSGIEEVHDKNHEQVAEYILWMACHDIKDEQGQED